MTRYTTISEDRAHMIAWGTDADRGGLYIEVYAITPTPVGAELRPLREWDTRHNELTADMAYGIALAYGIEDILWRTVGDDER